MINVYVRYTFEFSDFKMEAPAMLDHLQAIFKEETSCTLVTSLGERVEVKFILLLTDNFLSPIFSGAILPAGCHQPILGISSLQGRFLSAHLLISQKEAPLLCVLFYLI